MAIDLYNRARVDALMGRQSEAYLLQGRPERGPGIAGVYFLQSQTLGLVKIGSANNVARRLDQLRTACPDELRLIAVINGDVEAERQLHKKFARLRVRGEWFHPGEDLMRYIDSVDKLSW